MIICFVCLTLLYLSMFKQLEINIELLRSIRVYFKGNLHFAQKNVMINITIKYKKLFNNKTRNFLDHKKFDIVLNITYLW